MSKLLLVIDADELDDDCLNCPCRFEYVGGVECRAANEYVECEYIPNWCPLRPLPKYKECYNENGRAKDFADGWNACLDEIEKGEEKC